MLLGHCLHPVSVFDVAWLCRRTVIRHLSQSSSKIFFMSTNATIFARVLLMWLVPCLRDLQDCRFVIGCNNNIVRGIMPVQDNKLGITEVILHNYKVQMMIIIFFFFGIVLRMMIVKCMIVISWHHFHYH